MDIEERISFNALAVVCRGDYRRMESLRGGRESWTGAWRAAKGGFKIDAGKEWSKLEKAGVTLVLRGESSFPELLRETAWIPHALYVRGAPLAAREPAVAIVGTRKATQAGKEIARTFAAALAARGAVVVSGLALGIDGSAHRGALEGGGRTIAVLGNGLDRIYPREHERLGKEILAHGGTIVSEYPLGTPGLPQHFIERNRIVSGLSYGVVVVEAPEKSGALATARFAVEQNRDVFVVPGALRDRNYRGSHELVKSGAALVTVPEDVLSALPPDILFSASPAGNKEKTAALQGAEAEVYAALKGVGKPLSADEVCALTALDISSLNQCLSSLVIQGFLDEHLGEYRISR